MATSTKDLPSLHLTPMSWGSPSVVENYAPGRSIFPDLFHSELIVSSRWKLRRTAAVSSTQTMTTTASPGDQYRIVQVGSLDIDHPHPGGFQGLARLISSALYGRRFALGRRHAGRTSLHGQLDCDSWSTAPEPHDLVQGGNSARSDLPIHNCASWKRRTTGLKHAASGVSCHESSEFN